MALCSLTTHERKRGAPPIQKREGNAHLAVYIAHFPLALEEGPKEKTSKAAAISVKLVKLID